MGVLAHRLHSLTANLRGEHRPQPVPPKPHGLVTNVDPPLVEEIFHIPKGQREFHVHHHDEADHLGR